MLYKMKIDFNQNLINLIEHYNLINENFILNDKPLKREMQTSSYTFVGTKLEKLNKLKKKYNL